MYAICTLLIVHAVIGVLLCGFLVWRSWRFHHPSGGLLDRRWSRWHDLAIASRVAFRWPILLVEAALSRVGIEIADFSPPGYRTSRSFPIQEIDEVGRSARVLSSWKDGEGRLVVNLVAGDFLLAPDRYSSGVVCSVIVDRWTIAQLVPLLDRAVRVSPREFSCHISSSDVLHIPDDGDHVLRDMRGYLYRLVESESPPIHPLLGSAIGSLVAASEAGDLAVMSKEESDVVEAILDLASRGDLHRIARAIAVLTRPEIDDPDEERE